MEQETLRVSGRLERIGDIANKSSSIYRKYSADVVIEEHESDTHVEDHADGLRQIFAYLESHDPQDSIQHLQAIGHRVVHGGEKFHSPTIITEDVIKVIQKMLPLAPLHNAVSLAAIKATQQLCPQLPQVAVFDTAFFRTLPAHAYRYALPNKLYQHQHVRRYGFHGTSHKYVSRQAADYLQQPLEKLKVITLHLGNGASAAALDKGICIDTSMGMTPLEGLIMGTRCGDLDPSLPAYLARTLGLGLDEIDTLLNQDSGMKGLCGVNDMREVHKLANQNDEQAMLAIDMYCYRLRKYIGAYYTVLEGLDVIVFTAGVGENDPVIRQLVCDRLSVLGIKLDQERNRTGTGLTFCISDKDSKVKVLVIAGNEELEIARETISVLN